MTQEISSHGVLPWTDRAKSFVNALLRVGAIKLEGEYRLKLHEKHPQAPLSPFYVNLRTPGNPKPGPLTPELVREIGTLFYGLVYLVDPPCAFDFVAGIPNAGDPLAIALATAPSSTPLPFLRLKKEEINGERRIIALLGDQEAPRGSKVLLVDDVLTRADSKREAIDALHIAGLEVADVLVLVDREQGGVEELRSLGVRVCAAFTFSSLLRHYEDTVQVSRERAEIIKEYLRNN